MYKPQAKQNFGPVTIEGTARFLRTFVPDMG
jgi:hypothetical protein